MFINMLQYLSIMIVVMAGTASASCAARSLLRTFPPFAPFPPRPPPNSTQQAMAACAAAESMAPTVSLGMTSRLNAAFAKNSSHTKSTSGSKSVSKDGAVYNINYSTTLYGYNDITAALNLEQASCTATSNDVGSATGSYTVSLVWNGNTPYGTGITVNGQAKVYGEVCVPGVCVPAYTIPGVCSPTVCTPASCCCGGCCCQTCMFGGCCCKTCVPDTCIPEVCVPGVCTPSVTVPEVCSPTVCTPGVLLTTAPIRAQVQGLTGVAKGTYTISTSPTELCFTLLDDAVVTFSQQYVYVSANGKENGSAEYTATQDIQKMAGKMQTNLNAAVLKMGTKCQPWTPGGTPPPPPPSQG